MPIAHLQPQVAGLNNLQVHRDWLRCRDTGLQESSHTAVVHDIQRRLYLYLVTASGYLHALDPNSKGITHGPRYLNLRPALCCHPGSWWRCSSRLLKNRA
jgi:hypothetical protein